MYCAGVREAPAPAVLAVLAPVRVALVSGTTGTDNSAGTEGNAGTTNSPMSASNGNHWALKRRPNGDF
jgi:hypothetical protein